jgi:hypothetical protein
MAIIQSYGLFWDVENVYWGRGSNPGSLLGVPARARSSVPVDFREQIGIYVLYQDHRIVYVGQAGSGRKRLFKRLRDHRKDHLANRWNKFSWFGLRRALASGELAAEKIRATASLNTALNHIEAVLISATEPSHNKQGGRFGKGTGVLKYIQYRDERLGPTEKQMLRDLWQRIESN